MWQADTEMVPMSSEGIPWNSQEKMGKTLALKRRMKANIVYVLRDFAQNILPKRAESRRYQGGLRLHITSRLPR